MPKILSVARVENTTVLALCRGLHWIASVWADVQE